jgi:preprotein translocase subunit SecG
MVRIKKIKNFMNRSIFVVVVVFVVAFCFFSILYETKIEKTKTEQPN